MTAWATAAGNRLEDWSDLRCADQVRGKMPRVSGALKMLRIAERVVNLTT